MPSNGRWDLIRRLKVKQVLSVPQYVQGQSGRYLLANSQRTSSVTPHYDSLFVNFPYQ